MSDGCTGVPDSILWVDMLSACEVHDEHYKNHEVSREEADIQLRENIKAQGGILAWLIAWVYYLGVRVFGSQHYQ